MKRVLVIGDNLPRQRHLAELLEGAGCAVESATHAAMVDALLQRTPPPDAVFLQWPGLLPDGRDFIHACRERSAWAFVPIAVVSSARDAADAYLLPAQAYLTEPFGMRALLETVEYVAQVPPPTTIRIRQPAASSPSGSGRRSPN